MSVKTNSLLVLLGIYVLSCTSIKLYASSTLLTTITLTLVHDTINEGEDVKMIAATADGKNVIEDVTLHFVQGSSSTVTKGEYYFPPTLVIKAGTNSNFIRVQAFNDDLYEGFEYITLDAKLNEKHKYYALAKRDSFTVVVRDGEANPLGGSSLQCYFPNNICSIAENVLDSLPLVIAMNGGIPTERPIVVNLMQPIIDPAEKNASITDYKMPAQAIIPAWGMRDTVWIKPVDNNLVEGDKYLNIRATPVDNNNTITPSYVSCMIKDDDKAKLKVGTLIHFNVVPNTLKEGEQTNMVAFLDSGKMAEEAIVVKVEVDPALSCLDLKETDFNIDSEIVILPGTNSGQSILRAMPDNELEGPQWLAIRATTLNSLDTMADSSSIDSVLIMDQVNNFAFHLNVVADSILEGDSTEVQLSLTGGIIAHDVQVQMNYSGSALYGVDYTAQTSLVFPRGQTIARFPLTALLDSDFTETTENVKIAASVPELADIPFIHSQASVFIVHTPKDTVVIDSIFSVDSSHVKIHVYAEVLALPQELCNSSCDVDMPYLNPRYWGLDKEKNRMTVRVDGFSRNIPYQGWATVHFSGVDLKYYTTTITAGAPVYFHDGSVSFDIVHTPIEMKGSQTLAVKIEVANQVKTIKVLFSSDFDRDNIPNWVERNTCIKATNNIFNEWYTNLPSEDADGDGISNSEEGFSTGHPYSIDHDHDCIPDFLDIDSNNDGIPDNIEKYTNNNLDSTDLLPHVRPALSLNNNGIGDDKLYIENIFKYSHNEFSLFDRNGNMIYKINGYDNKDKAFRGYPNEGRTQNLIKQGTYFYYLSYYDKAHVSKQCSGFIEVRY